MTTMQAVFNGTVITESDNTVVVEGSHYFPRDSLRTEYFVPTGTRSLCLWKVVASYLDVTVDGVASPDAAWRYEHPLALARRIRGRVASRRGGMTPLPMLLAGAGGVALAAIGTGTYLGLVTGRLTVDLGLGRRVRPLGPLVVDVAASPDRVFQAAAAPYAARPSTAMRKKVWQLERTDQMVLAAHRTPLSRRLTAVTVETVTLQPPHRIGFRLVRGPVPHVSEAFTFEPIDGGTRLTYTGELGTDLWGLGQAWGDVVARNWVRTVEGSFEVIRAESERQERRGLS